MRRGKAMSQVAHASMKVLLDRAEKSEDSIKIWLLDPALKEWINGSFTKVVVSVDSGEELTSLVDKAVALGLPTSMIVDNGWTEFHGVPTLTCAAIGPADSEIIDSVTSHLKLL